VVGLEHGVVVQVLQGDAGRRGRVRPEAGERVPRGGERGGEWERVLRGELWLGVRDGAVRGGLGGG